MTWNFKTLGVSSVWDVYGMHPGEVAILLVAPFYSWGDLPAVGAAFHLGAGWP